MCCLKCIALIVHQSLELQSLAVNWKHAEREGYGINGNASSVDLFNERRHLKERAMLSFKTNILKSLSVGTYAASKKPAVGESELHRF